MPRRQTMLHGAALFLAGTLTASACSRTSEPSLDPIEQMQAAVDTEPPPPEIQVLSQHLEAAARHYGTVGYSVAVLRRGTLVHRSWAGNSQLDGNLPITRATVFSAFSVAKVLFNLILAQEVEAGRIDPELTLGQYLDEIPQAWRAVTLRQAWSHISGLPDYLPVFLDSQLPSTGDAALAAIDDAPLSFSPGSHDEYNQTNFLVLRRIVEQTSGRPYAELVRDRLLRPLGLEHTYFADLAQSPPDRAITYTRSTANASTVAPLRAFRFPAYTHAGSALCSTPDDLATLFQATRNGHVVSRKLLEQLWGATFRTDGRPAFRTYGWERRSRVGIVRVGHTGGNRIRAFHYFREQDRLDSVTVVYLDNGGTKDFPSDILADRLAEYFLPGALSSDDELLSDMYEQMSAGDWPATLALFVKRTGKAGAEALMNEFAYRAMWGLGPAVSLPAFVYNAERFSESANAHDSLAEVYEKLGKREEALASYRQAAKLAPDDARIEAQIQRLAAPAHQ